MTRTAHGHTAEKTAGVITAATINAASFSAKTGVATSLRPDRLKRSRGVARPCAPAWAAIVLFAARVAGAADPVPQLASHILLTQDESLGTAIATTTPITTQASGSTLLALSMGWVVNFADPTDSFANTWTQIGGENIYAGTDFYTALWDVATAQGGAGHTLSVTKAGRPAGEISLAFIEVANGGDVRAIYKLAAAGHETPGSIAVDRPATLVAIWGGDSFELNHTAVPDNGFSVFDSYLMLGPTSGVQVAIAAKQVSTPGSYTVNWTSTPQQNAACYLIAVEWQGADTIFADGFNR